MRAPFAVVLVILAGCELIGDFSHLRIREPDASGTGGCSTVDCAALALTCGDVVSPCGMQLVSCDTHERDGEETDVDCGGATARCPTRCEAGKSCTHAEDCASGVCLAGLCQAPRCGDGVQNGDEACEDGNAQSYDGCSATCEPEDGHLLLSEVVFDDDAAEYIELHNPNDWAVSLEDYYLANYAAYFRWTEGDVPVSPDVLLGFPTDSAIGPRGFVVVSLESATAFEMVYGLLPDYDMVGTSVPVMSGADLAGKLGNDAAVVILFHWDGIAPLVSDVDYLLYGTVASAADKTGEQMGSATYRPDTAAANQSPAAKVGKGQALYRCDTLETTELDDGGNGLDGHDETSEDCAHAFAKASAPTPGAPPAPRDRGPCP